MSPASLTLRFPCHPRYAARGRQAIELVLERIPIDENLRSALMFAAGEAISGTIKYAQVGATFFELRIRVREGTVRIDIENDGRAFDPRNPQLEDTRGFGITIMRNLVDNVAFFKNGQIVRLEQSLPIQTSERSQAC